MELRDFQAFVAVAEELHFGRAAARLHISQPPLSARIRQLELDLGIQLFERSTRTVSLTDAGARLLVPARKVLSQVAMTRRLAESIAAGDQGRVRIGFAGASTQRVLPILTRAVREAHPGVELQLRSQTYVYTALDMLLEGSLDLAFARLPTPHPELESRVIEVEQILCALPEGHPLAARTSLSLAELHDEDFVSLPADTGSILQSTMYALCITAGFRPRVVQVAPDSATVLALVAAGAGMTITLSSVSPSQTVGIAYRPLDDVHPDRMFATLTWRKDDPSAALAAVLDVSEEVLPTPDSYAERLGR
ncbi:LysR substrate-binding domain-containing protein [Rathayibacter sp. VKM Ac-2927]|uniref:LysR substrate-binding domain-containing protein n=1 Tax=Rathayibacter sp. VKM Ac-2927 TaxID=2929478 RepID=UPI001FB288B8|nr:LysR substrate-binding domain-containing protein [Rathayibacter sp. VKM Ac-2927]MCJ1688339.1 LysR substrate-binding domain-containing protein [Rathayibacter sp. VKM Ac-2927]